MKTMTWLLKREYWEHKGSIVIAPLIVSALMLLISIISLANMKIQMGEHGKVPPRAAIAIYNQMTPQMQDHTVGMFANMYMAMSAPIFVVMVFAIFLFCINSLYDERKDRSILFWKSLPISDNATVLSKAAVALVIAPLFALVIATAMCMLQLIVFCTYGALNGANFFAIVFGRPEFFLAPLRLLMILPVYMLWALPTVGWLMLVSAWARSKVFLWAVVAPLVIGILLWWANKSFGLELDTAWYWNNLIVRGLLGLVPGVWFKIESVAMSQFAPGPDNLFLLSNIVVQSWDTLAHASVWIGALAGAAMIYGATRLRGRQDEG